MKKSKKMLVIYWVIAAIPTVLSAALVIHHARYIKYASVFGDIVHEMAYNYAIAGGGFTATTASMYSEFQGRGNVGFGALCVLGVILLGFLIVYFASLRVRHNELLEEQNALLRSKIGEQK